MPQDQITTCSSSRIHLIDVPNATLPVGGDDMMSSFPSAAEKESKGAHVAFVPDVSSHSSSCYSLEITTEPL